MSASSSFCLHAVSNMRAKCRHGHLQSSLSKSRCKVFSVSFLACELERRDICLLQHLHFARFCRHSCITSRGMCWWHMNASNVTKVEIPPGALYASLYTWYVSITSAIAWLKAFSCRFCISCSDTYADILIAIWIVSVCIFRFRFIKKSIFINFSIKS